MRFFIIILSFFSFLVKAQVEKAKPGQITVLGVIKGKDTIPMINLRPMNVIGNRSFIDKIQKRKYDRLVRDVKKVYPYAKAAGMKLRFYNEQLLKAKTEKERSRIMKRAEHEIKAEFTDDIENMTMNQGRILLKLIDRETGQNSYLLVKELRGSFSAFFWQSVAKIFNTDLKSEYDPYGADKNIEEIIHLIDCGEI